MARPAERDVVDSLIDEHGPDAIVAAVAPQTSAERATRIEAVLAARLGSLTVVVENLYDPHNGGACIRSVEAVGLAALHAVEGIGPFDYSRKVTTGCDKWVDVHRHRDFAECAAALETRGMTVYAAVPGAAQSLHDLEMAEPSALMFGNEHAGLTDEAIAGCDGAFSIPMSGFTESLNLSVSVAVTVHTLAAKRRRHIGKPGDLSDQERARLRARWYALGIRGLEGIVDRFVSNGTHSDVAAMTRPADKS